MLRKFVVFSALALILLATPAAFAQVPHSADTNDDGLLNIGDAINLLSFLFTGGATLPYPYPGYGIDPTSDSLADCLP